MNPLNLLVTLIISVIVIFSFVLFSNKEESAGDFKLAKDPVYGKAKLANLSELKSNPAFMVCKNVDQYPGIILGKLKERIINVKPKKGNNENTALIGSSGSGKTSSFILPNIINTIRRGESFLAVDPKGELIRITQKLLKREGYNIHILNFKNPEQSDQFNLMENTKLTRDNIIELADMIFFNLGLNQESGAFFEEGAKLLLTFLLSVSLEFKELLKTNDLIDPEYSVHGFRVGTLGYALDLLYAYEDNVTVLKNLHRIYKEFSKKYPGSFSKEFWKLFSPGEYSDLNEHYLANLKRITMFFFDENTLGMFSGDNIKIDQGLKERTAYFLIMAESLTSNKNKLASVFINMLMVRYEHLKDNFRDLYPQSFRFILDEFGAIGKINGFEGILSGCRSRDMSVIFAIQDITQLKTNYYNSYDSILGNCNLKISTGVKDTPSRVFISELMGSTTIERTSQTTNKDGNKSMSQMPVERALFKPDELLELEGKCIGISGNTRFLLDQLRYYEEFDLI